MGPLGKIAETIHRRRWTSAALLGALALAAPSVFGRGEADWGSRHFALELTAAWLSIGSALLVLCYRRDACRASSLWIGSAFLSGGLFDLLHALLAEGIPFQPLAHQERFIPATWSAGRAAFAALLLIAAVTRRREIERTVVAPSPFSVGLAAMALALACVGLFALAPLPVMIQSHPHGVHRPWEWIGAAIHVVVLAYWLPVRRAQGQPAEPGVYLAVHVALAMGFGGQMLISTSAGLYDAAFNAAHAVKVLALATAAAVLILDLTERQKRSLGTRAAMTTATTAIVLSGFIFFNICVLTQVRNLAERNSVAGNVLLDVQRIRTLNERMALNAQMAGRGDGAEGSLRYAEAKALHLRTIERLRRAPIDDEAFAALTRLSWSEKTRFDIEAEAMRRVESGAYDAARELLDSEEYARAKRLFTIEAARLEGFVAAEARRIESEEKRVARRGIFCALLALAIGGAYAMLLGLRLGRRLLRPIDRLTSVTSAVAAGRFGARVVVAGRDELAALATGMNAMLDKIAEQERALKESNRELAEARDRANELSRAKGAFLATMSHEIRTPMNGVLGMADLLIETELDDRQYEFARDIQSCGRHLLAIVNDILDFSRLESGRMEILVADFDLRALIGDVDRLIRFQAEAKGLNLATFIDEGVPSRLRGDPGRIRQVLINLLNNAVKFTPAGEIALSVEPLGESETAVKLRFSIEDTGIGIARERQSAIFESFTQADVSTFHRFGGSGLGLSICRQLVKLMGGSIGLESEPDKGSRFHFNIELQKQPAVDAAAAGDGSDPELRVLILAANADRHARLREILAALGHRVVTAADAESALEALARSIGAEGDPIDLGLVDEFDAESEIESFLARRPRPGPAESHAIDSPPMVYLAPAGQRGDAERARALGCAGYYSGDLDPAAIGAVIGEVGRIADERRRDPRRRDPPGIVTRHCLTERRRQSLRILLAEDNPINRKVALGVLERAGFRLEVACHGREAVERATAERFDLILMDCQMPGMSGCEATKEIRRVEAESGRPRAAIVAMTAGADAESRDGCLAAGMDDFISKPVVAQNLIALVDKFASAAPTESPRRKPAPKRRRDSPAQPPPVDLDYLRQMTMDDLETEAEVIRSFIDESPKMLDAVRRALGAHQFDALARTAHKFRGACGALGARELHRLFGAIERGAVDNNLLVAEQMILSAESELRRALEAFGQRLAEIEPAGGLDAGGHGRGGDMSTPLPDIDKPD